MIRRRPLARRSSVSGTEGLTMARRVPQAARIPVGGGVGPEVAVRLSGRRRRPAGRAPTRPASGPRRGAGDGRVERLGRGDGGLDRGQAQDSLAGRRQADLGRVADGAGLRRRGVDHEPHLARRDQVQDRQPVPHRRRPSSPTLATRLRARSRGLRRARGRVRPSRRSGSRPGRGPRPAAAAAPCRDRRSTGAASGRASAAAGRGGTSAAPRIALARATRGSAWMPITSPVDCMPGPDRRVDAAQLGRREGRRLDRHERSGGAQQAVAPAQLGQRLAERDPDGQLDHRHAGHLGQERHGPRRRAD